MRNAMRVLHNRAPKSRRSAPELRNRAQEKFNRARESRNRAQEKFNREPEVLNQLKYCQFYTQEFLGVLAEIVEEFGAFARKLIYV